jgi:hypothetical protein
MAEGTGMFVFSDIYSIDNIVRHVGIVHGRNLLIDTLKEVFERDREYHYVRDIYGFPKTPDHTGLDLDAGVNDTATTRVFIGTTYRYEQSFLPAISVKQTSSSYRPISFNQNKWTLTFERQRTEDGYGNVDFVRVPSRYIFAGAWDQSFEIKVTSNSQEDTAALADIVMISLQSTYRNILEKNGLFIKQITAGGESAESINANDPVFNLSITANTYSEWRREIPIASLVDRIQLCFSVDLGSQNDPPATGLDIKMFLE